jgi:hypothetical protein
MIDIATNLGFTVVAGDADSLFLDGNDTNESRIRHLIVECKKRIGVDVEHYNLCQGNDYQKEALLWSYNERRD